jgi:hypothetical protein
MMARQKWKVERSDQKNAGYTRWCYVIGPEQYTQQGFQIQFEVLKK